MKLTLILIASLGIAGCKSPADLFRRAKEAAKTGHQYCAELEISGAGQGWYCIEYVGNEPPSAKGGRER